MSGTGSVHYDFNDIPDSTPAIDARELPSK